MYKNKQVNVFEIEYNGVKLSFTKLELEDIELRGIEAYNNCLKRDFVKEYFMPVNIWKFGGISNDVRSLKVRNEIRKVMNELPSVYKNLKFRKNCNRV